MTPHKILGIAKGADEAAIKRAFRKLAMALHPDRNPEPGAEEKFKTVRAAYDAMMAALKDDEADAEFSEEQETAENSSPPEETRVERGEDLHLELELTLEEACAGCERTLTLDCAIPCGTCEGSGESGPSRSNLCSYCHGSGRLRDKGNLSKCAVCDGRGFRTERTCPDCEGSGHHVASRQLQVRIPAGVVQGGELRLVGQGKEHPAGGLPGHLFLRVVLLPHKQFHAIGRDLVLQVPISIYRWIAGGEVALPKLGGGKRRQELPPAKTLIADPLRIRGAGLPGHGRESAGDLIINWQIELPKKMTDKQRELLAAAEKLVRE